MSEKTSDKPVKGKAEEKKPGAFARFAARISKWFREMRSELKKVTWPTRKQVINNTWVVIVAVIVIGAIIGVLDYVLTFGINALSSITDGLR